jgi:putative ABC transport system ATP-binding protein
VLENIQASLMLGGTCAAVEQQRVELLLTRVGLASRLHKRVELSLGQQQRVALANDRAVILADEPTGNLDLEARGQVLSFLEELRGEGRTVNMVTHDSAAASHATRVIKLRDGVVESDTAQRLILVA